MNAAITNFGFIAIWCIIFQNGLYWHCTQLSYFLTTFYIHHNCVILLLSKLAQIIVLLTCIGRYRIQISSMTPSTLFGGFPWSPPPFEFFQINAGMVHQWVHVSVLLNALEYIRHQSFCHLMIYTLRYRQHYEVNHEYITKCDLLRLMCKVKCYAASSLMFPLYVGHAATKQHTHSGSHKISYNLFCNFVHNTGTVKILSQSLEMENSCCIASLQLLSLRATAVTILYVTVWTTWSWVQFCPKLN
jgi:hypothetical protein